MQQAGRLADQAACSAADGAGERVAVVEITSPSAAQFASMAPLLLMAVMPPTQVRPLLEMAETVTSVQLFVMTPFMACAPRMPPA